MCEVEDFKSRVATDSLHTAVHQRVASEVEFLNLVSFIYSFIHCCSGTGEKLQVLLAPTRGFSLSNALSG
jgi:hypothetical protein